MFAFLFFSQAPGKTGQQQQGTLRSMNSGRQSVDPVPPNSMLRNYSSGGVGGGSSSSLGLPASSPGALQVHELHVCVICVRVQCKVAELHVYVICVRVQCNVAELHVYVICVRVQCKM